ncbi:MAG: metal-dependent hydrolase [Candidatus Nanosalina sp.]
MMFSTHILAGGTLGLIATFFAPQLVPLAVLGGMIGGFLPDVDMFAEHRKTGHRPFQYLILTTLLLAAAYIQTTQALIFASFLFASMTLHGFMEIYSNGKTMRPQEETDDRAVYNHLKGEWIEPKRWVLCSSKEDLAIMLLVAAPLLYSKFLFSRRSLSPRGESSTT